MKRLIPPTGPANPPKLVLKAEAVRSCRVCGCTDNDCRGCIERTGRPCYWVRSDLCSACVEPESDAGWRRAA
jgi:hypothetical protein